MNPIFPSILSGHFYDLESKLRTFSSCGIEAIHLDVMDGHFVPNLSFGPAMIRDIKTVAPFIVDAHLMVDNPLRIAPWFIEAGADWISIHVEIKEQAAGCISLMKQSGKRAGLVINPDTPVQELFPFLSQIDYVLLMSVFPGYGGQSFILDSLTRISMLKDEIMAQRAECLIQVDGGLSHLNVGDVVNAGADLVVVGSALYGAAESGVYIERLLRAFGEKK